MLDLVAITTLAGIVIGAFQLSGLTSKLPMLLMSAAGGNVLLLLVLTAVVSILLGMSLPTTVVYITLAVLVGPALAQLGIVPLAAHLFLFYFGMLSLITPPDCLATYAAAAIAKSDFWKTGWTGMRLGIVAYVVPFVFVFHPALHPARHAGRDRARRPHRLARRHPARHRLRRLPVPSRSAGAAGPGRSRPGSAS